MNKIKCIFICLALYLLGVTIQADSKKDILKQRGELERVQKEVEDSHNKLSALKGQESELQKKVQDYDRRIVSGKKVVGHLNAELKQLQADIKRSEQELDRIQEQYDLSIKRYLGNIRQLYMATKPGVRIMPLDPNIEAAMERRITLLTALANFETVSINKSSDYLAQTIDSREKLLGEKKKVTKLKQTKETSTALEQSKKEKGQKELDKVRRKKTEESDRLVTLEQAEREMEMILVRLEQARQERGDRRNAQEPSFFVNMKGRLRTPYQGEIVKSFGSSIDKLTKLKSFSPGIDIKGVPGGPVFSVAAGSVAYVGDLRGYGNFVILDHDGQHFTTYAGLEQTLVIVGELVATGMKIGSAADNGLMRFELRKGREPLDPVQWISLDSF